MKSLRFFKPTLATTLAIILAWLLSVRPAQAGYTVTLQQVGPDVVATGSGAIDLFGLNFNSSGSANARLIPSFSCTGVYSGSAIVTGPTSSSVNNYSGQFTGPGAFGVCSTSHSVSASSGGGDMVGIGVRYFFKVVNISVPMGYVSGTAVSDSATYSGQTFATLGVTPGTYIWKWGTGANQNFTLQILPGPNITNFSARASVQTGPGVTIAGFIVTGATSKQVVVRGLGPSLTQSGVSGVLADPTLQLIDGSGKTIFINDNWKDLQQTGIQATGLAPPNDAESAMRIALQPGNYTAILAGKNGATGVGLVEVYDIETGVAAALTNASTRGFVGTDENVMIAGFIASGGNGSTQVMVRGLGPALTQFGISGALADPELTLVDGNGNIVRSNNNWKDSQQAEIQATGKAPPNDLEAAILATVPAGNYTAILSGNGGGTGIGLIEVYKLR